MLDPIESYCKFAPYARYLIESREHVEPQLAVVRQLVARYQLQNPKIFDAACGTGEVLEALVKEGFDAIGCDASPDMLSFAGNLPGLRKGNHLLLPARKWQALGKLSSELRFDFIYILGNSFAHLAANEVQGVFDTLYDRLNDGGIFAFDMRYWIMNHAGQLRQSDRPENVRRWLGDFEREGQRFFLDDCCKYTGNTQQITYFVQHLDVQHTGFDDSFPLEYSIFDLNQVQSWLLESKFKCEANCFSPKSVKWPYLVVVCRK